MVIFGPKTVIFGQKMHLIVGQALEKIFGQDAYVCVCLVVKCVFVWVWVCEGDFVYQFAYIYNIDYLYEHINRSVYNMSVLSNFSIWELNHKMWSGNFSILSWLFSITFKEIDLARDTISSLVFTFQTRCYSSRAIFLSKSHSVELVSLYECI